MNKSFFMLFFVFLSLCLNQEVSAEKNGKIEEDEVDIPTGISKSIQRIPPAPKKKGAIVDFQLIRAKPVNFPTPKALARKERLQRTFWEHAMKIDKEGNTPQETEVR